MINKANDRLHRKALKRAERMRQMLEKGRTQSEIARRYGISRQRVSAILGRTA